MTARAAAIRPREYRRSAAQRFSQAGVLGVDRRIAGSRLWPPTGAPSALAAHFQFVDIAAIALIVTAWTAALTLAIGCCVVVIMKGPAYVADRYDLSDAESPRRD